MRVAFVGASSLAVTAAHELLESGHDVVIIDRDPQRIEELAEELDCGLVHGDGSRPGIQKEIDPEGTQFLFCLANSDEANILAALVGLSLGFDRVVPKVDDSELEPICTELGLDEVIVPDRAGAARICDLVEGRESPAISAVVRAGLRFYSFSVHGDGMEDVESLDLPPEVRVIAYSRGEHSSHVNEDTRFEPGDEIIVLTSEDRLEELQERFRKPEDS